MTTTTRQLRALVSLRWRMVRSPSARLGFALLAGLCLVLFVAAVMGARAMPRDLTFNTALLLPSALMGFAVLALIAPLVAGGGYELYPDDQLVAYPVRPATLFLASVIQAPLNLAWLTQVLVLTAATSFVTASGTVLVWALLLLGLYVAAVTTVGQSVAWLVIAARQSRNGRILAWAAAATAAAAFLAVLWTHHLTAVLDRSPTVSIVAAMVHGPAPRYAWVAAMLAAGAVLAGQAGVSFIGWYQRRPTRDRAVTRQASSVRRRVAGRTAYSQLLVTDRASVWRSTALRRGALVTGLLPGAIAAIVGVDWFTITTIPGLIAAGAGLLYGVNFFSLDAQGAVWLASQPLDPRTQMRAKVEVVAETCLLAAGCSVLVATLSADRAPTLTEAVSALAALIACSATVVAICTDLSVMRPHRADLRGARDTPAPPGAMVGYSVRLATVTTVVGMTFAAIGRTHAWAVSVALCLVIVLLAALSVQRDLRKYADFGRRSIVVTTVTNG